MSVLLLSVAVAPAQARGAPTAQAADDDIPGVPIESVSESPLPVVFDSLDPVDDGIDVYSVYAFEGEQVFFRVDPDPDSSGSTLDVWVALWGPWADSVADPPIRNEDREGPGGDEYLCYTVPVGGSGTYYVAAVAAGGDGETEYFWGVTSRADGNVPGVPLPPSGFEDRLSGIRDDADVFAVHVGQGATLDVDVTVQPGDSPISAYIFGPGTVDVWASPNLDADENTMLANVSCTPGPGQSGVYYVCVHMPDGLADYTLDWQSTGPNVPGRPAPPSPSDVALGTGTSVGYVDLRSNESYALSMTDPGGVIDMRLLRPSTTDVNAGVPVAVATGSGGLTSLEYQVPEGEGGRYYIHIETPAPTASTLTWSTEASPYRLAGATRYDTAVAVSRRDFPGGAHTVVIASGEGFPDALSAAGLAGAYDAPVLLVQKSALPPAVRDEIVRLGARRCLVVGGPAVIDGSVLAMLDSIAGMATPTRIGGADRYETSALVADAVFAKDGWVDWPAIGAMARGDLFADALALAPIAWAAKLPILLTRTGELPAAIEQRLVDGDRQLPFSLVVFAGGDSAISQDVYDHVATDIGISSARLFGADRYETAADIAEWSSGSPWLSFGLVGVATGADFPDALGGGAAIGKAGGVLLLTRPDVLSPVTGDLLTARASETHEVQVLGGEKAVSGSTLSAIQARYTTY